MDGNEKSANKTGEKSRLEHRPSFLPEDAAVAPGEDTQMDRLVLLSLPVKERRLRTGQKDTTLTSHAFEQRPRIKEKPLV